MGSGIAQLTAQSGFATIQYDVSPAMLEKSRQAIHDNLNHLLSRDKITEQQKTETAARIRFTNQLEECAANLVVEAIVENMETKLSLYRQLSSLQSPDTLFASNTSSLSITELQAQLPHPGRFAGLHFFNPAPVMKLVEVVQGSLTHEETMNTLVHFSKALGKIPVRCKDAPGFIVNHVARPYYLEAMKLVSEGYATMEQVDEIMEASGFKMGPFKLMDLIGMDVNLNVSKIVWEALGKPDRLKPADLQQQKVAAGELGKKTGKGFYNY
jgi:3-hydroxybutyryl-CoA dehydrogenase